MEIPDHPWSLSTADVLGALEVDPDRGLDASAVEARRERYGPNRIRGTGRKPWWRILVAQLESVVVALLAVAAIVSLTFGQQVEAAAIGVVVVLNTLIGFFTEIRAVRSMEALRRLGQADAVVRRSGETETIAAGEVVPGDVVRLDTGEVVSADTRLIEVSDLEADESALTGESTPVRKGLDPVAEDAPLAERSSMVFKGTAVTRGSGWGVVVATGMDTEVGAISSMVEEAGEEDTPLQRRLDRLGTRLVWLTVAIAAAVSVAGILAGRQLFLMVETGIALAVAAVPEGLPIVATIAMARGVRRMARRNALVRRLSSVETLGSTTVICADKTGTLTENRMRVSVFRLPGGAVRVDWSGEEASLRDEGNGSDGHGGAAKPEGSLDRALEVAALCNEGLGDEERQTAEPMEEALMELGRRLDRDPDRLVEEMPRVRFEPFDRDTFMTASFHRVAEGRTRVLVKGAPESVLEASSSVVGAEDPEPLDDEGRADWHDVAESMAADGLRVLALAYRDADEDEDPYRDLVFLGFVGLEDPPREDVPAALERCRDAGIRIVMMTGDHPETARHIAREVGLLDGDGPVITGPELRDAGEERILEAAVFARLDPEQKLDLIRAHRSAGDILAMTGDGVNDAPALEEADIGIAMGERGTEVAREAADMVLLDDAFPTITAAIEHGRIIFQNIRRFVVYLLSGNVGEVLAVGAASVTGSPLPLLPLQILYLNMINDVFPALALGIGGGAPDIMKRPPRDPDESVLGRRHWAEIGGYGMVIGGVILGMFAHALTGLDLPTEHAVTLAFLVLSVSRLLHAFNMRDPGSGLVRNEIVRNPWVWVAFGISLALLALAVYFGPLAAILGLVAIPARHWLLVLGVSVIPLVLGQLYLAVRHISSSRSA